MGQTNLREADNVIKAGGILSEKALEVFTTDDGKTGIKGTVTLQTSSVNTVTFSVYAQKLTKEKKENKAYAGLETIMNSYKSIAEVGKANADWVEVRNGKLQPNTYIDQSGTVKEGMRYASNFFNRIREAEKDTFVPSANFEIELVIKALEEETDRDGVATGRVIVHGWVPTYSGIGLIKLVAPADGGVASAILDSYAVNETVKFYGTIASSVTVEHRTIKMKIGADKVEEYKTYVNELVITGASEAEEEPKAYDLDAIRSAIAERDSEIQAKKAKASASASTARPTTNNPTGSTRRMPSFM